MRKGTLLALSWLLIGEIASGQERVPLPSPDPNPVPLGVLNQPPTGTSPPLQPLPPTVPAMPPAGVQQPTAPNTQPGPQTTTTPLPPPPVPNGPAGPYVPPGPNGPYGPPGPYGPYGPPPPYPPPYGPYGPYGPPPPDFAPRLLRFDSANDPSFWVGAEGLLWWSKNEPLPVPVITTGPASQGMNAGGLGVPGTVSLNQPLNFGVEGGVRLYAGGWFDQAHTWGLEGSFFILGDSSTGFGATDRSGVGNTVLNEPLYGNPPFSTQVSYPGVQTGGVNVWSDTQLWGLDINGMYNLYRGGNWNITLLGGFRYLELDEQLNITANSTLLTTTTYIDNAGNTLVAPPGSGVSVVDQFNTHNSFYGGQIGARVQYQMSRWNFEGTGLLAIGGTHESVSINGSTTVYPTNGQPVYYTGGNYATNQIGQYSINRFAVMPEMRLNVGYQITPSIRATIGYDFLFLSSVMRPGEQIDNTYNGINRPGVPMTPTTFWAQGLNLNLRFSF